MPQYVIRLEHTSDQCPSSNAKIRDRVLKSGSEIPKLAQKLGVKLLVGPLVLGAEHWSIVVAEADRIEMVEELLLQAGVLQWNSARVSTAKSMEESIKDLEKDAAADLLIWCGIIWSRGHKNHRETIASLAADGLNLPRVCA